MHNLITKRGRIFVAGDYKDKNFKMTKEDVTETVRKFTSPVPLDLNHHKTLKRLESKLGQLKSVSDDGNGNLFGEVEIPEWLNEVVCKDDDGNDLPLPVSCAFGKDKTIVKLALTDNPRVKEAAIFAAFAEANPEEATEENSELVGEGVLATELGSAFTPSGMAEFTAELVKKLKTTEATEPVVFKSELSEEADEPIIKETIMDEKVTLLNRLLAFLDIKQEKPEGAELSEEETPVVVPKVTPKPEVVTVDFSAELATEKAAREAAEARVNEMVKAGIKTQAQAFATEIIAGKHAQESERATIEAAFSQALEDDNAYPVEIQFSADSKGSRADAVRAIYGSKKVVPLTEETLDETETETLLSDDQKSTITERQAALKARAKELAERENTRLARIAARK